MRFGCARDRPWIQDPERAHTLGAEERGHEVASFVPQPAMYRQAEPLLGCGGVPPAEMTFAQPPQQNFRSSAVHAQATRERQCELRHRRIEERRSALERVR